MKKKFDCVKFQRDTREKLWKEAGETVDGLFKLLDEKSKTNELWISLTDEKFNTEKLRTL